MKIALLKKADALFSMSLKDYLILQKLKKIDFSTQDLRTFGLQNKNLNSSALLKKFIAKNQNKISQENLLKVIKVLKKINFILLIVGFILGLISSFILLTYSGKEPVNLFYYLFFAAIFPIFWAVFTIFSIFKKSFLSFNLSYYFEKLISYFLNENFKIDKKILKFLIILRSAVFSLSFGVGLLIGFLIIVFTQDIAFGWSSTVNISSKAVFNFLNFFALPWKNFLPTFAPSLELVESSKFFRLNSNFLDAQTLALWWKYLFLVTLTYSVILRGIVFLISYYFYKKTLKEVILNDSKEFIKAFKNPIISIKSDNKNSTINAALKGGLQKTDKLSYDAVIILNGTKNEALIFLDSLNLEPKTIYSAGINLDDDKKILQKDFKEVLLIVKSWDIPTFDFLDFIKSVAKKAKVTIVLAGLKENGFKPSGDEVLIWESKLKELNSGNIFLYMI